MTFELDQENGSEAAACMEDGWRQVTPERARCSKRNTEGEKVWSGQLFTNTFMWLDYKGMTKEVSQTLSSQKKRRLSPDDGELRVTQGRGRHGQISRVLTALNMQHTRRSVLQEPAMGMCNNHGAP